MKFRTKIYISFVVMAVASVVLALSIMYVQTRKLALRELGGQALSIAASMAITVDADLLGKIQTKEDMASPEYIQIKQQLRQIRKANQRKDVYARYMYIVRPSVKSPGMVEFVVDASSEKRDISATGDLASDENMDDVLEHLHDYYAPDEFTTDQWGDWFSAYAPIFNDQNEYVATVGVDLYASDVIAQLNSLLYYGAIALGCALIFALLFAYVLSKTTSFALQEICAGVGEIGKGNLDYRLAMNTEDEFQDLGDAINVMCKELKEKELLKRSFSRYVSEHVLEKILKGDFLMKLEGERKKITVLFSDLRQFTTLSEQLPPETIVGLLNEYFECMLDVIFKNSGTLDKFIGDGIMVEFGSPLADAAQEKHAVLTALQMQEALKLLCQRWEKESKPKLQMGIGIHTGDAIVGNIGTLKRMEYTAIGDTVNVASRLESETKRVERPILVSETTWNAVQDAFEGENLGQVNLPGRSEKITIYAIKGLKA
jgi:adenylate cyclase